MTVIDTPTITPGTATTGWTQACRLDFLIPGRGVAVLLVSHNMKQVMELSNRVYVFRRGRIAAELRTAQTTTDEIIAYITGARG